jgi:hypothetical protein
MVTIRGSNLLGGAPELSSVTLNGRTTVLVSQNDTMVIVAASSGAGAEGLGDVVLQGTTGATTISVNAWTYLVAGSISTVAPGSGQGGTRVTIAGSRLLGGGTSVLSVTLAGTAAASIGFFNDTVVEAVAAVASQGQVMLW